MDDPKINLCLITYIEKTAPTATRKVTLGSKLKILDTRHFAQVNFGILDKMVNSKVALHALSTETKVRGKSTNNLLSGRKHNRMIFLKFYF